MNEKVCTVTMQWPVRYDFPPGVAGYYPPCKVPTNKTWEKIERLLRKAIER